MTIAELMEKMIAFSNGERQDIDHFIRVWTFARTIAEGEGLDAQTQFILEAAAITHDIACPLCREKYGYTNGKYQEREGAPMARRFLEGSGLSSEQIERIVWLVGETVAGLFSFRQALQNHHEKGGLFDGKRNDRDRRRALLR